MKIQPTGRIQDIIQQLGLQIISRAALMQYEVTSVDGTGLIPNLQDAEFIGGRVARLPPDQTGSSNEATLVDAMTVWLN
jgi:hypothetical protein